jgi:hypothetical protein
MYGIPFCIPNRLTHRLSISNSIERSYELQADFGSLKDAVKNS